MKKIFIVEDDLTIQAQLKTLLSGNGYEVFAVTEFSQTIQQIKTFVFCCHIPQQSNGGNNVCEDLFPDGNNIVLTGITFDLL